MKDQFNRREFLKVTAGGAAVAGVGGTAIADAAPVSKDAEWLSSLIKDFTATSPLNSLKNASNDKAWDEPLVGFSRGDDPLWTVFKDKVGPFHWTPLEIFDLTFPTDSAGAGDLTVISWILPHIERTKADLRRETKNPAERWVRARLYGEAFNEELRRHVVDNLAKAGHPAVAPTLSPAFKNRQSERYGAASTFSERHAAYTAGLGTFGLCDGLITAKGKAVRCGAVVARIQIPPTPRPYDYHRAYCLFYADGGLCGRCIDRCPGKAVSISGHDKAACQKQLGVTTQYTEKQFGISGYGCGFCETKTPCESGIPNRFEMYWQDLMDWVSTFGRRVT